MKIETLYVPKGVRYISDWEDFKLPEYPNIIDKQIPGCGFTEYCLTNGMDIILACPRRILLENKWDQHREDVYLVRCLLNDLGVDKDISKKSKTVVNLEKFIKEEDQIQVKAAEEMKRVRQDLEDYCHIRDFYGKPKKILVTYDSYRKVKECLMSFGIFDQFYTIVDEFQSIFVDSRFKSDTEIEFLNNLRDVNRLCYVSATPMIENYLDRLDEFKDLPYSKFDWSSKDSTRVVSPSLKVRVLVSVKSVAEKIISDYRNGNFSKAARFRESGEIEEVESREAVIYVNSVNNIINIIKWNNLKPKEVNILCANTSDNQSRINRILGDGYLIGRVPTREEPRKMFTLCTRTVYLGADFYSDNARTFIISDANIDSMAVDITLDLPQILGRQRLVSNPWKNKATLFVKVLASRNKISLDDFKELISEKIKNTERLLAAYYNIEDDSGRDEEQVKIKEALAKKYLKDVISSKYSDDYVAVNRHNGKSLLPVINNLALMSEQRAYDIQQVDYADRFTVFSRLEDSYNESECSLEVETFLRNFDFESTVERKMKYLCEAELSESIRTIVLEKIPEYFSRFYLVLGAERCRALGYNYTRMNRECENLSFNKESLDDVIFSEFSEGCKYTLSEIKSKLREFYSSLNYNCTPKATDIEGWFDVVECRIGKTRALKLIRRKLL